MVKEKEIIVLKKHRVSTHQAKFLQLKREMLALKWVIETNSTGKEAKKIISRMGKVAKLLFDIEAEFEKVK